MKLNYLVSNLKNGYISKKLFIFCENTKINCQILDVLYKEGYIRGYIILKNQLKILLKYNQNQSIIKEIKQISTFGNSIYFNKKKIKKNKNRNQLYIISTSNGIYSSNNLKIGGKVLISIK